MFVGDIFELNLVQIISSILDKHHPGKFVTLFFSRNPELFKSELKTSFRRFLE